MIPGVVFVLDRMVLVVALVAFFENGEEEESGFGRCTVEKGWSVCPMCLGGATDLGVTGGGGSCLLACLPVSILFNYIFLDCFLCLSKNDNHTSKLI